MGYTPNLNLGATNGYRELFGVSEEREKELITEAEKFHETFGMDNGGVGSSKDLTIKYIQMAKNEGEALYLAQQAGFKIKEMAIMQSALMGLLG